MKDMLRLLCLALCCYVARPLSLGARPLMIRAHQKLAHMHVRWIRSNWRQYAVNNDPVMGDVGTSPPGLPEQRSALIPSSDAIASAMNPNAEKRAVAGELGGGDDEVKSDIVTHVSSRESMELANQKKKKRGRTPRPPFIPNADEFNELLNSVVNKGLLDPSGISVMPDGYNLTSFVASQAAIGSEDMTVDELVRNIAIDFEDIPTANPAESMPPSLANSSATAEADHSSISPEDFSAIPLIYEGGTPADFNPNISQWQRDLMSEGVDPSPIRLWITSVVTYNRTHRSALEYSERIFEYLKNATNHDPRIKYETICLVESKKMKEAPFLRAVRNALGTNVQEITFEADDADDLDDVDSVEELEDIIQMWADGYNTHHLIDGFAMKKAWGGLVPEILFSEKNLNALVHQVKVALDEDESGGIILSPRLRNIRLKGGAIKLKNAFNTQAPDTEFSVVNVR